MLLVKKKNSGPLKIIKSLAYLKQLHKIHIHRNVQYQA